MTEIYILLILYVFIGALTVCLEFLILRVENNIRKLEQDIVELKMGITS